MTLEAAFSALAALDDVATRFRFYGELLKSRVYITVTDDHSKLVGKALQLDDGTRALPAFLDERALKRWIIAPTRYGTMPATSFFRAAAKMPVDAVVINPGGPALEINHSSIVLLARGINPAAVPKRSATEFSS